MNPYFKKKLAQDDEEAIEAGYYPFSLFVSRFFFKTDGVNYGDGSLANTQLVIGLFPLEATRMNFSAASESCSVCHENSMFCCQRCYERLKLSSVPSHCANCREQLAPFCGTCYQSMLASNDTAPSGRKSRKRPQRVQGI